jgi:hypothetical protein
MPIVSISEAARLSGKNRKTVQKYVADGQLSLSMDGQTKGIEISELIRVFGPLTGHPTLSMDRPNGHQVAPPADHGLQAEIEGLKGVLAAKDAHIAALAGQVDELREEKRELRAQVVGLLKDRRPLRPETSAPAPVAPAKSATSKIWDSLPLGIVIAVGLAVLALIVAQMRSAP